MQAGAEYLDSTLATLLAPSPVENPLTREDRALEQDIEPVLTELRAATASFKPPSPRRT
jgi:hypothetical protein